MSLPESVKKPLPSMIPSKIARPTKLLDSGKNESSSAEDCSKSTLLENRGESEVHNSLREDPDSFIVGDRIWVGGNKPGVIAFIGETQFGPGDWAGVVLDDAIGKNDGSVAGIRYFQCAPGKGIFTRLTRLSRSAMDYNQMPDMSFATPVSPDCRSVSSFSCASSTSGLANRSRKSMNSAHLSGSDVKLGDRIIVRSSQGSKAGVLRYYGNTEFGSGLWCGVELDDAIGKNNGTVGGVRYFECEPKFGLFVPAEKVSRSPITKKMSSACVVHPEGISRQGTLESIRTTSTVQTSASAVKNKRPTMRGSLAPSINTPTSKTPQMNRTTEKDKYIAQLLRERELERAQVTRAATQAEEAEKKLFSLKTDYDRLTMQYEIDKTNLAKIIESSEVEKSSLKQQLEEERRKIEDLMFNYEEESITKSEIQALNEEYVEKLKHFEKVVSSQHASLEYDVNLSSSESTSASVKVSSTPKEQNDEEVVKTSDENVDFRIWAKLLEDQKKQVENECHMLKDEIEKLKLIDKNKDEVISNLKKEIDNCQSLSILCDNKMISSASEENQKLQDDFSALQAKNENLEEQLRFVKLQLKELQDDANKRLSSQQNSEMSLKQELEEYKEKNEQIVFQINQLNATLSEKEEQLKSNSFTFIKYIKTFSSYLSERNAVISSALFSNESTNSAIDALRGKDMTCSVIFDDESDSNANIVHDSSDYSLQLKDEFLKLKDFVDQLINATVASLEKHVTLTEVINRKDELLEEKSRENVTLRREFQDTVESDRNEIDLLKNRYEDLNEMKKSFEKQLEKSEENLKKVEELTSAENKAKEDALANVQKALDVKCIELKHVCEELSTLKVELNRVNEEKETENEELRKEIDRFKNSFEILKKEAEKNSSLLAENEKLVSDYEFLKSNVDDSKNSLEKLRKENEKLTELLQAKALLESKCDSLEKKISELNDALEIQCKENEMNSFALLESIEKTKNERDTLQKENYDLRSVSEALQKEKETNALLSAETAKSLAKNEALREEINHIKTILDASQNENEKISLLIREKETVDKKNEVLLSEIEDLRNTNKKLQKEIEANNALFTAERVQFDSKRESHQQEIECLKAATDLLKTEHESTLLRETATFEAKKNESLEEISSLKNTLQQLQQQNERNTDELVKKSQLEADYNSLKREIETVQNTLELSQKENENNSLLLAEKASFEAKNAALETELSNMKQNLEEMRAINERYALLEVEKADSDARNNALKLEISQLKQLLEQLSSKNEKLTPVLTEKNDALARCESLRQEIDEFKNALAAAKNESENNLREKMEIAVKYSDLQGEVCSLRKENEDCASILANKTKLETEFKALMVEHENLLSESRKVSEKNTDFIREKADSDAKNAALQKEIEDLIILKEKFNHMNDENSLLVTSKAELQGKYEILQSEINDIKKALELSQKTMQSEKIRSGEKNDSLQKEIVDLQNALAGLREENSRNITLLSEKNQSNTVCNPYYDDAIRQSLSQLKSSVDLLQKENDSLINKCKQNELKNSQFDALQKESKKKVLLFSMNAQSASTIEKPSSASISIDSSASSTVSLNNEVEFLNSVIVEMQRKNESLGERLLVLENLVPPEKLKPKKTITPRLFCDICDIFDAHDTEDCPIQCNESEVQKNAVKTKPLPRPYCETCEVFGHDTSACNDDETF